MLIIYYAANTIIYLPDKCIVKTVNTVQSNKSIILNLDIWVAFMIKIIPPVYSVLSYPMCYVWILDKDTTFK